MSATPVVPSGFVTGELAKDAHNLRDGRCRRPVAVGGAHPRFGVVVEPVELEEDVLLRRLRAHRRQVQPSRGAEDLVAVADAVTVGVGHVRVRAGAAGADVGARVRLDRVGEAVAVGVGGGHTSERCAPAGARRRGVRGRDPSEARGLAAHRAAPLVRRVPCRDRDRVGRRGRQPDQDAAGRRGGHRRRDRGAVHLDRVGRDLLAVVILDRSRPRHGHERAERGERDHGPAAEVRRTRRDQQHQDPEDPCELHCPSRHCGTPSADGIPWPEQRTASAERSVVRGPRAISPRRWAAPAAR